MAKGTSTEFISKKLSKCAVDVKKSQSVGNSIEYKGSTAEIACEKNFLQKLFLFTKDLGTKCFDMLEEWKKISNLVHTTFQQLKFKREEPVVYGGENYKSMRKKYNGKLEKDIGPVIIEDINGQKENLWNLLSTANLKQHTEPLSTPVSDCKSERETIKNGRDVLKEVEKCSDYVKEETIDDQRQSAKPRRRKVSWNNILQLFIESPKFQFIVLLCITAQFLEKIPYAGASTCHLEKKVQNEELVEKCPTDKKSWDEAAKKKNCTCGQYHCLIDESGIKLYELCADVFLSQGYCVEMNTVGKRLQMHMSKPCTNFKYPCYKGFSSTTGYLYPDCFPSRSRPDLKATEGPGTPPTKTTPSSQNVDKDDGNLIVIAAVTSSVIFLVIIIIIICVIRHRRRSPSQDAENCIKQNGSPIHNGKSERLVIDCSKTDAEETPPANENEIPLLLVNGENKSSEGLQSVSSSKETQATGEVQSSDAY